MRNSLIAISPSRHKAHPAFSPLWRSTVKSGLGLEPHVHNFPPRYPLQFVSFPLQFPVKAPSPLHRPREPFPDDANCPSEGVKLYSAGGMLIYRLFMYWPIFLGLIRPSDRRFSSLYGLWLLFLTSLPAALLGFVARAASHQRNKASSIDSHRKSTPLTCGTRNRRC